MITRFTIFLICISSAHAFSQEAKLGEARFMVNVDNGYFEILINDTMLVKQYKVQLPQGKHSAKVWSPGYITSQVDFEVFNDSVTNNYVEMAVSNERKQFEEDYKAYRMEFHKSLTVPACTTLGMALTSGVLMTRGYTLKKTILSDVESYHLSANYKDANFYRNEIDLNNKKYNRTRIGFYSFLGLTAASLGTTIFTYSRFKKTSQEPKLNAESPFKDKFSFYLTPYGGLMRITIG